MFVRDVVPHPQPGELWAKTYMLSLVEFTFVGEDSFVFKMWTPKELDEAVSWFGPLNGFQKLWNEEIVSAQQFPSKPRVGDAWVYLESEEVFFVGPASTEKNVQVLSSWSCPASLKGVASPNARLHLLQPGPTLASEQVKSLHARLMEDDSV